MTLQPLRLNFLIYEENLIFFFYQCIVQKKCFVPPLHWPGLWSHFYKRNSIITGKKVRVFGRRGPAFPWLLMVGHYSYSLLGKWFRFLLSPNHQMVCERKGVILTFCQYPFLAFQNHVASVIRPEMCPVSVTIQCRDSYKDK